MSGHEIEPGAKGARKRLVWHPKPLAIPEINQEAFEQHPLIRSAHVLRYSFRRFEYFLSPNGMLREWLRLNLLVALIVGCTGILVAPFVTILLGEIAAWLVLVLKIVTGIVSIAAMVVVGFILLRCIMAMCSDGHNRR